MNQVLYTQNVHYRRAVADGEREARNAKMIATINRHDSIEWAVQIFFVWLLAMGVDVYRTLWSAWNQTGDAALGISAFIGMGLLFTGMCFAVWKRMR